MSEGVPKTGGDLAGAFGRWIAVLAALIAAGQAGSTWIAGHWQAEADVRRAEQELRLARVQSEGTLAKQFLELILAKDTELDDRALLLDALAGLDGHPLREWAARRRDSDREHIARIRAAYERQVAASGILDRTQREIATLGAQLEELNATLTEVQDNPQRRSAVQAQRVEITARLATLQATAGQARVTVAELSVAAQPAAGRLTPPPAQSAAIVPPVTAAVTGELLRRVAPQSAGERVDAHAPFIRAAMQEFGINDRAFIAAIIAVIAVETEWFRALEARWPPPAEMFPRIPGNTEAGDDERFKGRGYIFLTGRQQYARTGERLGLGTGLLVSPEDAALPEVAARIAMAFFSDRQERALALLAADDLAGFARLLRGSVRGVERERAIFDGLLAGLPIRRADHAVFVQFAGSLQRAEVRAMMLGLREEGWAVQGADAGGERRENDASEVRFGREADRRGAEELARRIQEQNITRRAVTAVRNPAIRPGALEVWISR